jgi:sugar phosphate isomerase/epimerase
MIIHRSIVVSLLAVGILAASEAQSQPAGGKIGLQLYSLRDQLPKDIAKLDEVRDWGLKYVELAGTYGKSPEDFKAELAKRGITATSGHFGYEQWEKDPEAVCAEAEKLGLSYAGCAWIPHQDPFDEAQVHKAAAVFNHAGEVAAKHHIKFFYHTHGYEFGPSGNGTLFDLLLHETNPKNVKFEADVFWVASAKVDPAKLLLANPKRFDLLHVKDMRKDADPSHAGASDNVVAGQGQLDMAGIIKAAQKIGVKYYFIEDESDISEQQIPQTIAYLKTWLSE